MKKSSSLKKVLTRDALLMAVIPILLLSLMYSVNFSRYLEREITERNGVIVTSLASQIDTYLEDSERAMRVLVEVAQEMSSPREMDDLLADVLLRYSRFNSLMILGADGTVESMAPFSHEMEGISFAGQDYYRQVQKNRLPYWSDTFIALQSGKPTITLALPMANGRTAVGFLDLARLREITEKSVFGPESIVVVTDPNGVYLAHAQPERVFQRERDPFILSQPEIQHTGKAVRTDYEGQAMLASVALTRTTHWPVIIYQSEAEAFAPLRQMRLFSLFLGILAILLTFAGTGVYLKKILRAVDRLNRQTVELANGQNCDFQALPFSELNQLAENFHTMAEKVGSRENELRQKNSLLAYNSYHDSLTGVYNRRFFQEELARLDKSGQMGPGLILLDLDGLKLINDAYGHEKGDNILREAARIFEQNRPVESSISRIGGDEFVILIPDCSPAVLAETNQRITAAVDRFNQNGADGSYMSVSQGTAIWSNPSEHLTDVLKKADDEMYRMKIHKEQSSHGSIIQALFQALEARDFLTEGHCERMESLAAEMGKRQGMSNGRILDLRLLARFHDIGKVGIPDRILTKPGPLDLREYKEMQRHSEIGFRIARASQELKPIADLILKNHERWDGQGYPLGLLAEEIPLECRIMAIVDAYDAMTNDRPYRAAMPVHSALAELSRCAGTQFDPQLVDDFIELIGRECRTAPGCLSAI